MLRSEAQKLAEVLKFLDRAIHHNSNAWTTATDDCIRKAQSMITEVIVDSVPVAIKSTVEEEGKADA